VTSVPTALLSRLELKKLVDEQGGAEEYGRPFRLAFHVSPPRTGEEKFVYGKRNNDDIT
jgi:hypothetical protein